MDQDVVCPVCGGLIYSPDEDAMRLKPCTCTAVAAPADRSAAGAKRAPVASRIDDFHEPIVPETRPNPSVKSPAWIASTSVGDEPQSPKVCCNCGADVTGRKRMKDSQGRYWCYACGKKDEQSRQSVSATVKPSQGECTLCHTQVSVQDLISYDGQFICPRCHREQKELADRTEARLERVNKTYDKNQWQRLSGLLAVLAILAIIIILRAVGILGK